MATSSSKAVHAADTARRTFLIQFGVDDKVNVDWSGSIESAQVRIAPWQFDPKNDQVNGNAWKCTVVRQNYWDTPYESAMGPTSQKEKGPTR